MKIYYFSTYFITENIQNGLIKNIFIFLYSQANTVKSSLCSKQVNDRRLILI